MSRWWGQFENVPWPDRLAALVGGHVRGADEASRLTRRTLMRYANLSGVLIYRSVSTAVYKRFPTMEHLVQAGMIQHEDFTVVFPGPPEQVSVFSCCALSGLMTSEELRHLEDLPSPHNKFWVPCMWFVSLALRARTEGRINNDVALTAILTVGLHRSSSSLCGSSKIFFLMMSSGFFFLCSGVEQFTGKVYEAVRL